MSIQTWDVEIRYSVVATTEEEARQHVLNKTAGWHQDSNIVENDVSVEVNMGPMSEWEPDEVLQGTKVGLGDYRPPKSLRFTVVE